MRPSFLLRRLSIAIPSRDYWAISNGLARLYVTVLVTQSNMQHNQLHILYVTHAVTFIA